jgi:hypothetical protein
MLYDYRSKTLPSPENPGKWGAERPWGAFGRVDILKNVDISPRKCHQSGILRGKRGAYLWLVIEMNAVV